MEKTDETGPLSADDVVALASKGRPGVVYRAASYLAGGETASAARAAAADGAGGAGGVGGAGRDDVLAGRRASAADKSLPLAKFARQAVGEEKK